MTTKTQAEQNKQDVAKKEEKIVVEAPEAAPANAATVPAYTM